MIYSFFYRPIQNLIRLMLGKKSFIEQLSNYLNNNRYAGKVRYTVDFF